jgi:hypothetical protein
MLKSRKALAALGGALVAAVGIFSVAVFHQSDAAQAQAQGSQTCIGTFEASTVSASTDTFHTLGRITLEMGRDDIKGILETQDNRRIAVTTQTIGNGIFLSMELSDGVFVFGQGSATQAVRSCRGSMAGTFTMERIRVAGRPAFATSVPYGHWLFDFDE